jgi:hypothetical protein
VKTEIWKSGTDRVRGVRLCFIAADLGSAEKAGESPIKELDRRGKEGEQRREIYGSQRSITGRSRRPAG